MANIAVKQVIPAMQKGVWSKIAALASRSAERARQAAEAFSIPKAYGSYEDLLADREIDAVYNPLPNHLHVPWTIKAAEAGKHILCEKPIGLTASEAESLLAVRDRTGMKIQEAFMVRTHPQWLGVRDLIQGGRIGALRSITTFFSYFNRDPGNVRNQQTIGGGGLLDIGCYPITLSRFICDDEPRRVMGLIERDPEMRIDRLTSATLDFAWGQSTFTCGTQLVPYQRVHLMGTEGRIEVEIPFNAPPDCRTRIFIQDRDRTSAEHVQIREFPVCNQYTVQGDLFSRAILDNTQQPIPLDDAVKNMRVIDAIFRSAESGRWEVP